MDRFASSCFAIVFSVGCSAPNRSSVCVPRSGADSSTVGAETALVVATAIDWGSSVLDAACVSEPRGVAPRRATLDGSAIIRRIGERAAVLIRAGGSSVLLVDGDGSPTAQFSLGDCNPHDIEMLDGSRALLTCFARPTMVVLDLDSGAVSDGPDLSAFARAGAQPDMDAIARVGERLFVTLELLDPDLAPTGPGLVVEIDATTLEVIDTDPAAPGTQAFTVCENPFTHLEPRHDGTLVVGCLGDLVRGENSEVGVLDSGTGRYTTLAGPEVLGGWPSAVRVDSGGTPYVIVWYPSPLDATVMRLVRLGDASVTTIYSAPVTESDQGLSGLAFMADGTVLVGNRSSGAASGVWLIDPTSLRASGPLQTTLPPLEIEAL